jgi:YhcH/YjgK/YiaL family protein
MIIGYIDDIKSNKWLSGIECITTISGIIENTDFSKLEDGTYNISDNLFYILATYNTTSNLEEKSPEAHRKYIDIQYIIYGEEKVGYADIKNPKMSLELYNEKNDVEFFSRIENEGFVILKKGMYAIFFPEDVHRPGISVKETRGIRKAIFKLPV